MIDQCPFSIFSEFVEGRGNKGYYSVCKSFQRGNRSFPEEKKIKNKNLK